MVIFANILLFIWSSKNCDIIYLKKKLKRIIGPGRRSYPESHFHLYEATMYPENGKAGRIIVT